MLGVAHIHRSAGAAVAVLVCGVCWAAVAPGAEIHATTRQSVREHVDLKLAKRTGSTKFQHTGRATGTMSGSVRSTITLTHSVVLRGTVTIKTSRGDVRLKVDGRARSLELRTKFNGTATIAGGTGRYAHATGKGTFKGVVNRSTWHATIDATGSLTY
jgi:hypothetical protein